MFIKISNDTDPTGKPGSSKDPENKCCEGEENIMDIDMDMDDSKINEDIDEPTRYVYFLIVKYV